MSMKLLLIALCSLFSTSIYACRPTLVADARFAIAAADLQSEEIEKVRLLGEKISPYPIEVVVVTTSYDEKTSPKLAQRRIDYVKDLLLRTGVPSSNLFSEIGPLNDARLVDLVFIEAVYFPPGACPPPSVLRTDQKGNGAR